MSWLTLFWTSFASATFLPGGSEALFVYLLSEKLDVILLLLVATSGNTLGSFVNYWLGKYALVFSLSKRYITENQIQKAEKLFERYGSWSLLFSWAPIIGDPLTFVAGIARYTWWKFLLIVGFAKMARYGFVYAGFVAIF
ncbi:MAG: DedA family protein [Sulfurospirillaceae bacterium]|nr:DedA family protein [Sulfurospirillaceae bacterium]MDD3462762.1 DedA family protein [Sulfurospirillaceae bacterium]